MVAALLQPISMICVATLRRSALQPCDDLRRNIATICVATLRRSAATATRHLADRFAFVEFETIAAAQQSFKLTGIEVMGHAIRVPPPPPSPFPPLFQPPTARPHVAR